MSDQGGTKPTGNAAAQADLGIIASNGGETVCAKCEKTIIAGKAVVELDGWPRLCPRCERWFHSQCQKFSRWNGFHCPSCRKLLPDTEYVGPDLAAFEHVGALEVALLVVAGLASVVGLVLALVSDQALPVELLAGLLASLLALPWLGIAAIGAYNELIPTLSDVLPGSAFRTRPKELEVPRLKLRVVEGRGFRAQPLLRRLYRIYCFYAKHGAIAICGIIVFVAFGLIIEFSPR